MPEAVALFLLFAAPSFAVGWWLAGVTTRKTNRIRLGVGQAVIGYQPTSSVNENNPPRGGSGMKRPEPPLNVILREDQDPRKARRG